MFIIANIYLYIKITRSNFVLAYYVFHAHNLFFWPEEKKEQM